MPVPCAQDAAADATEADPVVDVADADGGGDGDGGGKSRWRVEGGLLLEEGESAPAKKAKPKKKR